MRTITVLALAAVLLCGGCAYYRDSMDEVPDRGRHAYRLDDGAPSHAATPRPRSPRPASAQTVVLKQGQSLYHVADEHGVSLADLIAVNDITWRPVPAGTTLVLPSR